MDIPGTVATTLGKHHAVRRVRLVGSRAEGTPTRFSDWDFAIDIRPNGFPSVAEALPDLVRPLHPIAQQWERLSDHAGYMLVLAGPMKVDLLFDAPQDQESPWTLTAFTLAGIDDHFWDWFLWLLSKEDAGRQETVSAELGKMFDHLLRPMGVQQRPTDLVAAIDTYVHARDEAESNLGVPVKRALEQEVRKAWRRRNTGEA